MADRRRDERVDDLDGGENSGGDRPAPAEAVEERDVKDAERGREAAAEAENQKRERGDEPGTGGRAHVALFYVSGICGAGKQKRKGA